MPQLLRLIEGGRLDPTAVRDPPLPARATEAAYDVFAAAADTHALKVVLTRLRDGSGFR